jgi:large-conductance mechanosensitive channel
MIDIAIGVIIGTAFNKVVDVLVNPKYAINNLLRAEIASKSATSLLFSIST